MAGGATDKAVQLCRRWYERPMPRNIRSRRQISWRAIIWQPLLFIFAVSSLPLLLAACSIGTSRVSDIVSVEDLQKSNSGIAFLLMDVAGKDCPLARVGLGRAAKGGGYRQTNILLIRNNWWDKGGVPQVELPAGTYHITSWVCEQGRYVRSLGRKKKNSLSWASIYLQSYASFRIGAGEVVNTGYLRMVNLGGLEFVRFDVKDLPPPAHAQLRKERPRLYLKMITRLMKPGKKIVPEATTSVAAQ